MKTVLVTTLVMLSLSVSLNAQSPQARLDQLALMRTFIGTWQEGQTPGGTKDFYLTDDNNRMYYETYGSGTTAIVFVHGWSVTCRSWDDQIDFFKDKFKVILVDLPGFGNSEHNRQDWSMQHYGRDVAGLCGKLALKDVYLVGWSMGTGVVVEAAGVLGSVAKAVITVDQMHQTDNVYDSLWAEKGFDAQYATYKDFNALNEAWLQDSILTVRLLSMMPPEDTMPAWWKHSLISFFQWLGKDLKGTVSTLTIPMRAINQSGWVTNEAQWKSFYKDYQLTIFEKSNHFLVWQYPQKFNETLLRIITEASEAS
jgi:pimeloyl-ACP methyl ester carboxylesterase